MILCIKKRRFNEYGDMGEEIKRVYVECGTQEKAETVRNVVHLMYNYFDGELSDYGYDVEEIETPPIVLKI